MPGTNLSRTRQRRIPRYISSTFVGVLVLLLGVTISLIAWMWRRTVAALPELDGRVQVRGLSATVTVIRDAQGVPHILASTLQDLFFAQGYVTAQDRFWQMDVSRRYAAGELAEILGTSTLDIDKTQRTLMIRTAVEAAVKKLSPRDRSHFQSYANGVNEFISQHRDHLPIEFQILRYSPRPWTVEDSIFIGANMHQLLNTTYDNDLYREVIRTRVTQELFADLYPTISRRDHPPGTNRADPGTLRRILPPNDEGKKSEWQGASRAIFESHLLIIPLPALMPGSNNWAISGAHTSSGKPLLSNDMHLPHGIPNTWYEAHLHSGTYNVLGFTLPGLPFVIVGHNQRIAWGFTNLGADVQDLFVESFNSDGKYEAPTGWIEPESRQEIIHVRDKRDVLIGITITRHGPIISDILPEEHRKLALKWTLYDPESLQAPFFDIGSAQNWKEFRRALSEFGGPSQNVVYADVDGHIGYQATGLIPIRISGDGSLPIPGNNDDHEWIGYVPFDELPSVYDPASGILVTANSRITPDNYPFVLANDWVAPLRTDRIYRVLSSNKKFSPSDMLALQTDVYSDFDHFIAQRLVYAVDHSKEATSRAHRAADLIRQWDGRFEADSAGATLVDVSRRNLLRLLLEPKLGKDYKAYLSFMSPVFLENVLIKEPQRWLPPEYANFDQVLTAALEATLKDNESPADLTSWRWGQQVPVQVQHPIFGRIPILRRWLGIVGKPQSGNGFTVKQVGTAFGPSQRMTVDLSDLDRCTMNLVTGQSGQILSPHYMDQWSAWYEGRTFTVPFSAAAVQRQRRHQLSLVPRHDEL
jgi:penicillin G amidase